MNEEFVIDDHWWLFSTGTSDDENVTDDYHLTAYWLLPSHVAGACRCLPAQVEADSVMCRLGVPTWWSRDSFPWFWSPSETVELFPEWITLRLCSPLGIWGFSLSPDLRSSDTYLFSSRWSFRLITLVTNTKYNPDGLSLIRFTGVFLRLYTVVVGIKTLTQRVTLSSTLW